MEMSTTSSGELSSSTAVCASPGYLCTLALHPGSAACSATVYDNATTNSGTILFELLGTNAGSSVTISFNHPIYATKGLYVALSGTGAKAHITFAKLV